MTDLANHPGRASVVEIARDMLDAKWTGARCELSSREYREQCAAEYDAWCIVIELCGEKP